MRLMGAIGKVATAIAGAIGRARGHGDARRSAMTGDTYGADASPSSPISLEEFDRLKQTVLFTDEDVEYLRMSHGVLEDQVEDVLDVWYGFVGSHPFLLRYFGNKNTGLPEPDYLIKTRERFGRWILDTAAADYDRAWLDYQHEIGLRHHRTKKNRTDGARTVEHIDYRYLPAFIYPITTTLKPFLAKKGHPPGAVEKMHQAWFKSVVLQVTLWSYPYVKEGHF
jgi:hypothetical protein